MHMPLRLGKHKKFISNLAFRNLKANVPAPMYSKFLDRDIGHSNPNTNANINYL